MIDYLAALSIDLSMYDSLIKSYKDTPIEIFLKSMYPNIKDRYLVSYGMSKDRKNIKEKYGLKWALGDSGGFQIVRVMSGKSGMDIRDITPEKVLAWLEAECDAGMNLDLPPPFHNEMYSKAFDDCLRQSIDNFTYFQTHRKRRDLILYNIFHGKNFDYIDKWFNEVKNFDFEGWGISLFPYTDSLFLTLQLIYLDEQLQKMNKDISKYHIHLLGSTSLQNLLIMKYFDTYRNVKLITGDSSNHCIGARFRKLFSIQNDDEFIFKDVENPTSFLEKVYFNDKSSWSDEFKIFTEKWLLPCDCLNCSQWNKVINNNPSITQTELKTSLVSLLMNTHNIGIMTEIGNRVNVIGEYNKIFFRNYVEEHSLMKKRVFRDSIQVFKEYFENNQKFSSLLRKYESHIDNISIDSILEVQKKSSAIDSSLFE